MRGIWPMDTKPLSQVMVEQQMEVAVVRYR